jgi:hypothetical protein
VIVGKPQFCLSASVAFRVAGKLLQQYGPRHNLKLRLTRECGGFYTSLSLREGDRGREMCAFNIDSGRVHFPAESGGVSLLQNWPEPANYLLAFISQDSGLEGIIKDLALVLELGDADFSLYCGCAPLVIGNLLARFLYDRQQVQIDNGWANEEQWPEWLETVPEDSMLSKPYTDFMVQSLWLVGFGERCVIFDDEIAYLIGTGQSFDVCTEIAAKIGSPCTSVIRIEKYLRDEGGANKATAGKTC